MTSDINGTVVAIQGNPVAAETLTSSQDGYVLTWDQADGYLVAKPISSRNRKITSINSDYMIVANDDIIMINSISNAITISLPSSPINGQNFQILTAVPVTHNIIIDAGAYSFVSLLNYQVLNLTSPRTFSFDVGASAGGISLEFVFYAVTNKWYSIRNSEL